MKTLNLISLIALFVVFGCGMPDKSNVSREKNVL